jgi:hypothetical protein
VNHHRSVPRALALAALLVLELTTLSARAGMPRREPPLILGGARPPVTRIVPIDPRLPTGALFETKARPAGKMPLCSVIRPLCVHAEPGQMDEARLALENLELAYDRLVLAMGLPPPHSDGVLGGSAALDAYLTPPSAELGVHGGEPEPGPFSEASAFCELPNGDPFLLARNATLCVGEAIAFGLDSSETPHLRRGFATWLWWASGLPSTLDAEAIDAVQAHPEWPIGDRDRTPSSEGSALLFEYLETLRSAASPGELSSALFAASASPSELRGLEYVNEPDLFDVLRHSLDEEPARFASLMIDFTVARAFVGDRDDGLHLPALAWAGDFGRVRFDWSVKFSSLPRRVLVHPAVDSTGSLLIWLDLDEVALGSALGVRAEWEPPVSFQWQLVKLGMDGEELGRIDIPFQERGRDAEGRISNLEGARAVLIVGTNLEGIDLAHPFDPDVAPFEPHAATVYLVRM